MRYIKLSFVLIILTLVSCNQVLKTPSYPQVSIADLRILSMGLFEQQYELHLKIDNPNSFPLPLHKIDYAMMLNGAEFAKGSSTQSTVIPAEASETITLQVSSRATSILDQIRAIMQNETSRKFSYSLQGDLYFSEWLPQSPFEYSGGIDLNWGSAGS
jgi:LEA14-like dessication related protein